MIMNIDVQKPNTKYYLLHITLLLTLLFFLIALISCNSASNNDEIRNLQEALTSSDSTTTQSEEASTQSNTDFDGDGVPDDTDFYPYNPYKSTDDWGENVEHYPVVFAANDVSELNKQGLINDLKLAADYFGKYDVEWWTVGQEINAMLALASDWCDRRIERGQLFYFSEFKNDLEKLKKICMTETAHPHASLEWNNNVNSGSTFFTGNLSLYEGWMETYRKISLNIPSGSANAGMNRNMGYTATQSSIPFQYDPATQVINGDEFKKESHSVMVFHEYYHIVQAQHVSSTIEVVDETGNTVRPEYGPTAFSEGSANYLSEYLIRKLATEGTYVEATKDFSLKEEMKGRMTELKNMLINCPDFKLEELNYGNICDPYTFGQWAVAYLTHKINNMYSFHDIFWPKINTLTFIGAFEDTFGLTYSQFNNEFKSFLNLSIDEQLEIIPDINFIVSSTTNNENSNTETPSTDSENSESSQTEPAATEVTETPKEYAIRIGLNQPKKQSRALLFVLRQYSARFN